MKYFNRDINWLGFNNRVLMEADNADVPLYERIKFLSIFSSNLDEFFRVRYPALKTLDNMKEGEREKNVLKEVQDIINGQLSKYGEILTGQLLPLLSENNVHLYYKEDIAEEHKAFTTDFFYSQALSFLQPVILSDKGDKIELLNNEPYFIVNLQKDKETCYAIVNIPYEQLSRFISIPKNGNTNHIVFIDDIIRDNLSRIFPAYTINHCYSIKLTRSADIDIADEWSDLFEDQVLEMIQKREKGVPSRLLYEAGIPVDMLAFIKTYFVIAEDSMVEGGRYHNLKDLIKLPNPIGGSALYPSQPPFAHTRLGNCNSIFSAIQEGDALLHFPYHSYRYVLRFFNEAAIDPNVEEISVTLYRVASDSFITNALISAAKNGKKVTAFVELKARFDEANNLNWAKRMKAAGVRIVYSIPGIKVHAKVALVKRREGYSSKYYGLLSTGNFNESTARFYTDHVMLTADKDITTEIDLLFAYLQARQQPKSYPFLHFKHLLVAGFNFFDKLEELVNREIANHLAGKPSGITIKLNNLEEKKAIDLLYKASNAGVKVELIIRGICRLIPGVEGMSENITVQKIIGRHLEHSRVYIFENADNTEVYIGSADLMTRNIHRRIEVVFPVRDAKLKNELLEIINIQKQDNVLSVSLDRYGGMHEVAGSAERINSQDAIYKYVGGLNK